MKNGVSRVPGRARPRQIPRRRARRTPPIVRRSAPQPPRPPLSHPVSRRRSVSHRRLVNNARLARQVVERSAPLACSASPLLLVSVAPCSLALGAGARRGRQAAVCAQTRYDEHTKKASRKQNKKAKEKLGGSSRTTMVQRHPVRTSEAHRHVRICTAHSQPAYMSSKTSSASVRPVRTPPAYTSSRTT